MTDSPPELQHIEDAGVESSYPSLSHALGFSAAAWGKLLLAHAERGRLPFAIKEIANGKYLWVNPAMAALFGRSVSEVIGAADADLLPAGQWPALRSVEQTVAAQREVMVSEHKLEHPNGRREFSVMRLPLEPADGGAPRLLAALWTDLSLQRRLEAQLNQALSQLEEQQRANEQLRRQGQDKTLRDDTTGLYNSAYFDDLLRREIDLSSREHREFALVMIAIDAAPERSAEAESRVLEALGQQLRGNTRAMDSSCHLTATRFAVLLSGVGLATAHVRMESLRRQCAAQLVVLNGKDIGFRVSMGVASFPHTADSQEALIEAAERALSEAQRRGGNHVALASIRFEPV